MTTVVLHLKSRLRVEKHPHGMQRSQNNKSCAESSADPGMSPVGGNRFQNHCIC